MTRVNKKVHSRIYILETEEVKKAIMMYMEGNGIFETEKYTFQIQKSGICVIEMIDKTEEEAQDA